MIWLFSFAALSHIIYYVTMWLVYSVAISIANKVKCEITAFYPHYLPQFNSLQNQNMFVVYIFMNL